MKNMSPFQRANWASVCGLALVILLSCAPPVSAAVINQQPQSTNVLAGSNATFTVVASGTAPIHYRWSFNGTNLTNGSHINGATNATLIISNTVTGDSGGYRVGGVQQRQLRDQCGGHADGLVAAHNQPTAAEPDGGGRQQCGIHGNG